MLNICSTPFLNVRLGLVGGGFWRCGDTLPWLGVLVLLEFCGCYVCVVVKLVEGVV